MANATTTDEQLEKIVAGLGILLGEHNPNIEAAKTMFIEVRFFLSAVLHDLESCRREKRALQKVIGESLGEAGLD
jgi:hypothetical protein